MLRFDARVAPQLLREFLVDLRREEAQIARDQEERRSPVIHGGDAVVYLVVHAGGLSCGVAQQPLRTLRCDVDGHGGSPKGGHSGRRGKQQSKKRSQHKSKFKRSVSPGAGRRQRVGGRERPRRDTSGCDIERPFERLAARAYLAAFIESTWIVRDFASSVPLTVTFFAANFSAFFWSLSVYASLPS